MTCASVELIEAMRGVGPATTIGLIGQLDLLPSCGTTLDAEPPVFAWLGMGVEHESDVTCPKCLRLMAEARGKERTEALAVRADELMERAS